MNYLGREFWVERRSRVLSLENILRANGNGSRNGNGKNHTLESLWEAWDLSERFPPLREDFNEAVGRLSRSLRSEMRSELRKEKLLPS